MNKNVNFALLPLITSILGNIAPIIVGSLVGGSLGNYNLGDVLVFSVGGFYFASGLIFMKISRMEDSKFRKENERGE